MVYGDGLTNEERARRNAHAQVVEVLGRYVENGGEVTIVHEPERGTYPASIPLEEATRTITITVKARFYDQCYPRP